MITERDIYCSAAVLIRQFGNGAANEASLRARSLADRRDPEGQAVWRRIENAIRELQRLEPPSGEYFQ